MTRGGERPHVFALYDRDTGERLLFVGSAAECHDRYGAGAERLERECRGDGYITVGRQRLRAYRVTLD